MTFTIFELIYVTLAAGFICLVVLGHALLFSAIYKCLREDWAIGQRSNRKPPLPEGANMSPIAQWSIAILSERAIFRAAHRFARIFRM